MFFVLFRDSYIRRSAKQGVQRTPGWAGAIKLSQRRPWLPEDGRKGGCMHLMHGRSPLGPMTVASLRWPTEHVKISMHRTNLACTDREPKRKAWWDIWRAAKNVRPMLLKIACEGHVRNSWDFSCIPDGGLERIDIFHFIAKSTHSNSSDPFMAHVSMTFMHESKATSAFFERFLTSGKSSQCKIENAFIPCQQVYIRYRVTFINAPAVRKINTSVKHRAAVKVV